MYVPVGKGVQVDHNTGNTKHTVANTPVITNNSINRLNGLCANRRFLIMVTRRLISLNSAPINPPTPPMIKNEINS